MHEYVRIYVIVHGLSNGLRVIVRNRVQTSAKAVGICLFASCWCRQPFQFAQPRNRMRTVSAAHFDRRLQPAAKRRSFRLAKNAAQVVVRQLHAAHTGRLAIWHARNRAGDRRRGAAGAAAATAGELRSGKSHGQSGRLPRGARRAVQYIFYAAPRRRRLRKSDFQVTFMAISTLQPEAAWHMASNGN